MGLWSGFAAHSLAPLFPFPTCTACTPDGNGITYNANINIAVAVAMPDGGLITPVLKKADETDIYQMSRCGGTILITMDSGA